MLRLKLDFDRFLITNVPLVVFTHKEDPDFSGVTMLHRPLVNLNRMHERFCNLSFEAIVWLVPGKDCQFWVFLYNLRLVVTSHAIVEFQIFAIFIVDVLVHAVDFVR